MHKKYERNPRTVAHYLSFTLAIILSFISVYVQLGMPASDDALLTASTQHEAVVIPGGMTFGVKMQTRGVVVVGFSKSAQGEKSPAELAGIRRGDVILSLDNQAVNTAAELVAAIEGSLGKTLAVSLERDGKTFEKTLVPGLDAEGNYRAGLRVRDGTAGIGTVTAIDPATMSFVGLGHGICDGDTGVLMPLREGKIYDVSISSIRKGVCGAPGELQGYFSQNECGVLLKNTRYGVMGKMSGKCFNDITPVSVARRDEIVTGKATVICTLGDGVRKEYEISIVKIANPDGEDKNFVIEVTDGELLEKTGGIVQGMSGSPIMQNGKLVGAVTHVMVNEPRKGYGIFIENMLNAAKMSMSRAA